MWQYIISYIRYKFDNRPKAHCTISTGAVMAFVMIIYVRNVRGWHDKMQRTFRNVWAKFLGRPDEWHWMGMCRAVVLCSSPCILSNGTAYAGMAPNAGCCTDTWPNRFPPCGSWLVCLLSNLRGNVNVVVEILCVKKKIQHTVKEWNEMKSKHE